MEGSMEHNGYRGRKKEYFYSRLLDGKLHENLSGEENLRHGSEHKLVINEDYFARYTLWSVYQELKLAYRYDRQY